MRKHSNSWSIRFQCMIALVVLVTVGYPLSIGADDLDRKGPPGRPFCMFSKDDGWTDRARQTGYVEYITHKAGGSDRSGVPQVVEQIKKVLAVDAEFETYIARDENNAFAAVAGGKKILVVDVEFLEWINKRAQTEWGAIQIVAHEVGHHIAGFSGRSHDNELNADYWSGFTLQRLGSGEQSATAAILSVGTEEDTPSHPNKYKRERMIKKGWRDAKLGKINYSHCDGCQ